MDPNRCGGVPLSPRNAARPSGGGARLALFAGPLFIALGVGGYKLASLAQGAGCNLRHQRLGEWPPPGDLSRRGVCPKAVPGLIAAATACASVMSTRQARMPKRGRLSRMHAEQGSKVTSCVWTDRLDRVGTRIAMKGKGLCRNKPRAFTRTNGVHAHDMVRHWRSPDDTASPSQASETGSQAKAGNGRRTACRLAARGDPSHP
jgi:hypothetical protein